ncbi:hypothetical protein H6P81_014680 [Aristolochia fimbriata]|uniref:AB hydrolase-1 domain-containing protein n=1 Tax=Aristolochia fimbriata TaxID=158543 RepID=A0AAV7E330_ARIFI|nr:hypothetical protein H6P81_014680 [Aristolochia fimbriata]
MASGLHQFRCFTPRTRLPEPYMSTHQPVPSTMSKKMNLRCRAASVSGSGAEYSEPLIGVSKKQKKQSIAGVDQDELVEPTKLADPDSCFCEFNGVHIHHKICEDDEQIAFSLQDQASSQVQNKLGKIGLPFILLHGFGASVFSWHRVMKPLAKLAAAKVLAFDRPAFGLTSRVTRFWDTHAGADDSKSLNPYSMAFSVLATLYFINSLEAQRVILLGHSAGCLVAVNTYFEAPERVAAMILVAPAIAAPLIKVKENKTLREDETEDDISASNDQGNVFIKIGKVLSQFYKHVRETISRMVVAMSNMVNTLFRQAVLTFLRSALAVTLVRMIIDKFGLAAVRNAWFDGSQVTDHILDGYTKPLRVKDWDRALVEYAISMLADTSTETKPPLGKRLHEIKCPVLIITGDSDRLVPSWNAKRVAEAVPGSHLEVIKNCGHLPHEERVEEFLLAIEKFLQTVFGAPQPKPPQSIC